MKPITIIYPDGKPHYVTVTNCELYELNGVVFALLVYIDNGVTCITPVQIINGQMYKVPFHDIDLENAIRIGELPLEQVPSVISTVIFRDEYTEAEEMEALQAVANATYAQQQWLTATATQRKDPPRNDIQRPGPPKFKHTLYTTYYYDPQHRPITVNNNAIVYQHSFGLYEHYPQRHTEVFEKPVLFREIYDTVNNYVHAYGQAIQMHEELAPIKVAFEATPGTTIADQIQTPDGRVREVLLLAVPGIHEYTVHFGKTPYKQLHHSAKKPQNKQARIIDDGTWTCEIEDAFRAGFNLEREIILGDESYGFNDLPTYDTMIDNSTGHYRR